MSFAAVGAAPEEVFASRGWSAADWAAARDRLAARGWIDAAGQATDRGRDGRDEIEWMTRFDSSVITRFGLPRRLP